MATDDERRRVAAALRAYDGKGVDADTIGEVTAIIIGAGDADGWSWREIYARLADLIEPDTTTDTTKGIEFDAFSHGINSIYEWCFEHLEGADGAEDELFCSIMRAIEDYRHPERATAYTVRPVDRDALLALADEMDHPIKQAVWNQTAGVRREHIMAEYARRIREACGEVAS